jgi:hypothetical protein
VEPTLKLTAVQALLIDKFPFVIGNSNLEYTLGQINCNGSSMHFGLLSSKTDPRPHEHRYRLFGDEKVEESIPSVNRTACKLRLQVPFIRRPVSSNYNGFPVFRKRRSEVLLGS